MTSSEIKADECYLGGRIRGKRGRGAAGKVSVFGLLKRGGKVCEMVIKDTSGKTLFSAIRRMLVPDGIAYMVCWGNVLDVSDFLHVRINHSEMFAKARNHINGIENF